MQRKFNAASGAEHVDVYTRITNKVIADLEKGVRPWERPWQESNDGRVVRPLRHDGTPYRGINVFMLWSEAVLKRYSSPYWMTFKQANELNAHVRKGEHGSLVVYANTFHKTTRTDEGEEIEQDIPFLKGYTVFNVEQIEGLPEHYYARPPPRTNPVQRIEAAEAFFRNTGAVIIERGNRAYYTQDQDRIHMPPFEAFPEAETFYSVLSHEITHWTKHPDRLARDFGRKKWGDEGYAFEELVAEMGSCFLCADLELIPEPREENAAYLDSWLKVLKQDTHAIFSAASHAQKAAEYLHNLQPEPQPAFTPDNPGDGPA